MPEQTLKDLNSGITAKHESNSASAAPHRDSHKVVRHFADTSKNGNLAPIKSPALNAAARLQRHLD